MLPVNSEEAGREDVMDILARQRNERLAESNDGEEGNNNNAGGIDNDAANADATGAEVEANAFPPILMRRYELRLIPRADGLKAYSLRHIRSSSIGKLVSVKGMITRCSDVKPTCEVCTYSCDRCGFEIYQETKGKSFNPKRMCPSPYCVQQPGTEETLYPQTRGSKFSKFQEIKLQELPNQVPIGHIPRCMNVHIKGDLTR